MSLALRLLLVFVLPATARAQAQADGLAHMQFVRAVAVDSPDPHYVAVDQETWTRAREDLGDLRLQEPGGRVVPYALRLQGDTARPQERAAAILQPGRVSGGTRFWIVIPDTVPEYDRVRLDLDTRNFVARARAEGASAHDADEWTALGETTLFDFEREGLGASFVLQLPVTRFRYLRITVPEVVRPRDVRAALVPGRARDPRWMPVAAAAARREEDGHTVFRWTAPEHIPLDRVRFAVDPAQASFVRRVEIRSAEHVVATGTIRRVNRRVGNQTIELEELDVPVPVAHGGSVEAWVRNGDDPPLAITQVTPLAVERRLYFDPRGHRELALFFGDPGTGRPEYDFARIFDGDEAARQARVGPVRQNPEYRPRPDTRPWSERHPWLLWTALAAGVAVLGLLALRALRTG